MDRLSLLIIFALTLFVDCRATELVPADRTAIFPATKASKLIGTVCYAPPDSDGYWTPTQKDLDGVEEKLIDYLESQHSDGKQDWTTFRKQVAGIKRGDDALLFIYYFRFDRGIEEDLVKRKTPGYNPDAWKHEPYLVFDGGDWFFRVVYDLKTRRFVWFERNGEA